VKTEKEMNSFALIVICIRSNNLLLYYYNIAGCVQRKAFGVSLKELAEDLVVMIVELMLVKSISQDK
jgi:hypothetical protein